MRFFEPISVKERQLWDSHQLKAQKSSICLWINELRAPIHTSFLYSFISAHRKQTEHLSRQMSHFMLNTVKPPGMYKERCCSKTAPAPLHPRPAYIFSCALEQKWCCSHHSLMQKIRLKHLPILFNLTNGEKQEKTSFTMGNLLKTSVIFLGTSQS